MDRLGLTEDELCRVLGVDPLTVIGGDLDDKPQLPILMALTGEAAERVGEDILRRWLRASGPGGRPLDHLLAGDYPAFEDDLVTLADRGFVLRAAGGGGGGGGRGGAAGREAAGRHRSGGADRGGGAGGNGGADRGGGGADRGGGGAGGNGGPGASGA